MLDAVQSFDLMQACLCPLGNSCNGGAGSQGYPNCQNREARLRWLIAISRAVPLALSCLLGIAAAAVHTQLQLCKQCIGAGPLTNRTMSWRTLK